MFSWFKWNKKRTFPKLPESNPGQGSSVQMAFTDGSRRWSQNADLPKLLVEVLRNRGYAVDRDRDWVVHSGNGLAYCPQFVDHELLEDGGVRTVTTIQAIHPELMPAGVFEYQHSAGDTLVDAIQKGFDGWSQVDCPVYLEALRPSPESCTALEMQFPAKGNQPAYGRRALLGPVAHFMQHPPPAPPEPGSADEHPFCPCCLLTRSFEAFNAQLEGTGVFAIRLYAARDGEGLPEADCRINGEEYEPGKEALRRYAATWPPAGYEFRKQYVLLHSVPAKDD